MISKDCNILRDQNNDEEITGCEQSGTLIIKVMIQESFA